MAIGRTSAYIRVRPGGGNGARHDDVQGKPVIRQRSGGNKPGVTATNVTGQPVIRTQGKKSPEQIFDQNG